MESNSQLRSLGDYSRSGKREMIQNVKMSIRRGMGGDWGMLFLRICDDVGETSWSSNKSDYGPLSCGEKVSLTER